MNYEKLYGEVKQYLRINKDLIDSGLLLAKSLGMDITDHSDPKLTRLIGMLQTTEELQKNCERWEKENA